MTEKKVTTSQPGTVTPAGPQSLAGAAQSEPLTPAGTLSPAEAGRAEKIRRVYGVLGQILDERRREGRRREKDELTRVRWPIRATYTSWILWLLAFALYPQVINITAAQILLMVNTAAFLGFYAYILFDIRKIKRKSARERFEEEGEKAALQMVTAGRRLREAAGGEPLLKEVLGRKKSDLTLAEARLKIILDFLKGFIPGAVALAALFGVRGLSANNTLAGSVLALFGAGVTLIAVGLEAAAQRRLIEEKECVAMLEQALAAPSDETPPPKPDPSPTTEAPQVNKG